MATIPGGSFIVDTTNHAMLTGTAGDDQFFMSHSFDTASGGNGDDFFNLLGNHNSVDGGSGQDHLRRRA